MKYYNLFHGSCFYENKILLSQRMRHISTDLQLKMADLLIGHWENVIYSVLHGCQVQTH